MGVTPAERDAAPALCSDGSLIREHVKGVAKLIHVERLGKQQVDAEIFVGVDILLREMSREDGNLAAEILHTQLAHEFETR